MESGAGYTSRAGLSARPRQDHVQISIEKFNFDDQISDLRRDVGKIKQLAYAIDEERKLQGAEINALEELMDKAKLKLGQARRRLNIVFKQSRSNLLLYVVLFIVGLCLLVFVLAKLRKLGRLLLWR